MHHWASVQCTHLHSAPKMPGLKPQGRHLRHSSRPPEPQLCCHWSGNTLPHGSSQILFSWLSSWLWCCPSLSMAWAEPFFPRRPRSSKHVRSCGTSTVWGWIIPVGSLCTPTSNTSQQLKEPHNWRECWRVECYTAPQMERKVCWGRVSKWPVWHRDAVNGHVAMLALIDQYTNSHITTYAYMCLLLLWLRCRLGGYWLGQK